MTSLQTAPAAAGLPAGMAPLGMLFHGSLAKLEGQLRPGGYDGLFWTAENSAVAQVYIPPTGGKAMLAVDGYEMASPVRPARNSVAYELACRIGPAARVMAEDHLGHATSFAMPKGYATYADVLAYVTKPVAEGGLGYANELGGEGFFRCWIKTDGHSAEHGANYVPADYRRQGSLVIVRGYESMKFANISLGEPDLTAVQYHSHTLFNRAREQGYDGVIIDDFCQSPSWGNVGHRSIGFFDHAIARLRTDVIAAAHFDWGPTSVELQVTDSPEFLDWRADQEAQGDAVDVPRERAR